MSNRKDKAQHGLDIIRLVDLHKAFGPQIVLDGVNLSIRAGETTAIIGPSGSGKTVLIKHIAGLIRPDKGRVFFREHEVSALSERELAPIRRNIGFVFQGGALFDSMTVEENICFPLEQHSVGDAHQRVERAAEVLALVGLDGLQRRYPEELSGGQKKRVSLARALSLGPEVILYDEPTTGLDPIRSDLINELILKLQDQLKTTAVVVTHDMASARKVANRICMLHNGQFVADATPDELENVQDDIVARFIGGKASDEELAELRTGKLSKLPGQQ